MSRPTSFLRSTLAALGQARDSVALFGKYMQFVGSGTKLFTPHGYDFDSLENRSEAAVERVLEELIVPLEKFLQAEVRGVERVAKGPVLFVGNHSGGGWSPEIFLLGAALYRRFGLAALPYGLAHEIVNVISIAHLLIPLGAVRASPKNAARIFEAGRNILVFPGGDEDSLRKSTRRDEIVFAGRRGYVRLAIRHGVPIVPVVTFGAHDIFWVLSEGRFLASALGWEKLLRMKACPIMLCAPWGITVGPLVPFMPWPARVCLEFLEPIHFERSGEAALGDERYVEECDERVRTAMQTRLTLLAQEHRLGTSPALKARPADNDQLTGEARRTG